MAKPNQDYNSNVKRCLSMKNGLKLEEPNDNLAHAYIDKAKSALNILDSSIEKGEQDWIATTAYYARYNALYALFNKCGLKSEIHDCSISAMKFLFVDEKVIEDSYFEDLEKAKFIRVQAQYYVAEESNLEKIRANSEKARDFVLRIEEILTKIDKKDITEIRDKLSKIK